MLRENYKNDIFDGKRKYEVEQNADGTVSLNDVTVYRQTGDIFNADDINATNKAVNNIAESSENIGKEFKDIKQEFSDIENTVEDMAYDVSALLMIEDVELSDSGWSSSAPYTQKKTVKGITAQSIPVIGLKLTGTLNAANVKAQRKAYGYLDRAVTGKGEITFYCYNAKPTTTFKVSIKGA